MTADDTNTTDPAPEADTAGQRPEPSLDEIKSVLDELGLTPGQIKGRLEASRKWEDRAKEKEPFIDELKAKAKQFDEFQDAQKTEQQKLTERAERAEQALVAAESARLRASIAAKHGVPEVLLSGSTEEALEEAATALLAFKGTPPSAPSSDGQGNQGPSVSDSVKQLTREDIQSMTPEQIVTARAAGQLKTLLSGGR